MTRMSMEEFADVSGRNISLRDFHKRQVKAVGTFDTVSDDRPVWTILFYDDAKIHNYDPTIPAPGHIVGAELNMIILGAHDPDTGEARTELRFGLNPVYLNPLEYAMQDTMVTSNEIVFAQRSRANL